MADDTREALHSLAAEITRVVISPYPTQLKALRDLASAASGADVESCLRARPCHIGRLAQCVLQGLSQWPYVLDLVARLSCNASFRDALLAQEPALLQSILAEAAKSGYVRSKYSAAAVSILSHPLPPSIGLPAEVQSLFLRLVEDAARTPSTATIQPVHALITGTCTLLIGLLPPASLSQFQDQLFRILRSSTSRSLTEGGDTSLALYCLEIMRVIGESATEQLMLTNSLYDTQDLLASTQHISAQAWDGEAMQEYFAGQSKGPKTLQLIVLRVIEALHPGGGDSLSLQNVMLANRLITAVPADMRRDWCAGNAGAVHRLQQKALTPEIGMSLRFYALTFIVELCKGGSLAAPALVAFREMVTKPATLLEAVSHADHETLTRCIADLDPDTGIVLLRNVVRYLAVSDLCAVSNGAGVLNTIAEWLSTCASNNNDFKQGVCDVLLSPNLTQDLQALASLQNLPVAQSDKQLPVCHQAQQCRRQQLCHELSALLIKCALSGSLSPSQQTLSRPAVVSLLSLHATPALTACACIRLEHTAQLVTFVEETSTQHESGDWRHALQSHYGRRAESEHRVVERILHEACSGLEARCENVELPLREEQERRQALEEQYEALTTAYTELEVNQIDGNLRLEALETERSSVLHELDEAREETGILTQRIQELEAELADANRFAKAEQSTREAAEMLGRTERAQQTEELEEARERVQSLELECKTYDQQLEQMRSTLQNTTGDRDSLRAERDILQNSATVLAARLRELEHANEVVGAHRDDLETQLRSVQSELTTEKKAHEREVQQVKEYARQNILDANASHNETMDHLAARHGGEVADLEQRVHGLREEMESARVLHTSELTRREDDLAELREKAKLLRDRLKERNLQLRDANAMRTNLMAALGVGGTGGGATQLHSLPHRSRTQEPQFETSPPTPISSESQQVDMSIHSSMDSQSGPTPKRAKPRKSVRVSTAASPAKLLRSIAGARASRMNEVRSAAKRVPLGRVSGNIPPCKMGKTPRKGVQELGEIDDDDSTIGDESGIGVGRLDLGGTLDGFDDFDDDEVDE